MKHRTAIVTVLALVASGLFSGWAAAPGAAVAGPCGFLGLSATHYQHVIWIWMENKSYPSIIGSPAAPYANSLATSCGLATNYHNITHPSLPNYIGATSGLAPTGLTQFTSDCAPSASCSTSAQSIFGQVPSWRAYEESMPTNCDPADAGLYAVRHNPPPYFRTLTGCGNFDVAYPQLSTDLTNDTLPRLAFVTPNLNDDTHNTSVSIGDQWLQANLPAIFASAAYQGGTTVVFLTWDEGVGGTTTNCANNTTDIGCHVANIVISPSTVAGTRSSLLYNHYSMLHTTEQLLGVPALRRATKARSMLTAFNL
jgi:phospholipase C